MPCRSFAALPGGSEWKLVFRALQQWGLEGYSRGLGHHAGPLSVTHQCSSGRKFPYGMSDICYVVRRQFRKQR